MNNKIPITLTIAGSDSGGGAGIQADIKVFSALEVYSTSVITALTAQNTMGVDEVYTLPAKFVAAQMESIAKDIHIDAVKIGMLSDESIIKIVSDEITKFNWQNIVVDPVMVAQSGDRLIDLTAVTQLCRVLFPLATIITPNLPEAALLLNQREEDILQDPWQAVKSLQAFGSQAVLLKGGHANGGSDKKAVDWLLIDDDRHMLSADYIDTPNLHGTGCSLSSAIAAGLAQGRDLYDAVSHAKQYTNQAIKAGQQLVVGKGSGPIHHFYRSWEGELK